MPSTSTTVGPLWDSFAVTFPPVGPVSTVEPLVEDPSDGANGGRSLGDFETTDDRDDQSIPEVLPPLPVHDETQLEDTKTDADVDEDVDEEEDLPLLNFDADDTLRLPTTQLPPITHTDLPPLNPVHSSQILEDDGVLSDSPLSGALTAPRSRPESGATAEANVPTFQPPKSIVAPPEPVLVPAPLDPTPGPSSAHLLHLSTLSLPVVEQPESSSTATIRPSSENEPHVEDAVQQVENTAPPVENTAQQVLPKGLRPLQLVSRLVSSIEVYISSVNTHS